MVWEEHIYRRLDLMDEFHSSFLASPIAATSSGWLFKCRMHQLLATDQILRLFPILCHLAVANVTYSDYAASIAKKNPIELQLSPSPKVRRLVDKAKLKARYYYRPKTSNFPTIDSFRLIYPPNEPPILLAFQITRNKKGHDAKMRNLRRIAKLVSPSGVRLYLVVVTPRTIRPIIMVPVEYFPGHGQEVDQVQDEDMDIDEDEDMDGYEDGDEGTDEEGGGGMDGEQDDGTNAELWKFLPVFHYPVDMDKLSTR